MIAASIRFFFSIALNDSLLSLGEFLLFEFSIENTFRDVSYPELSLSRWKLDFTQRSVYPSNTDTDFAEPAMTEMQIDTPALVLNVDVLERNISRMAEYLRGRKAK